MDTKFVEIRDRGTFIPALAFSIEGADHYLARRAGFGARMVYLVGLNAERCAYDPYNWPSGSRTYKIAHLWLSENWDAFESGGVVDVEFILGERTEPKVSESETVGE